MQNLCILNHIIQVMSQLGYNFLIATYYCRNMELSNVAFGGRDCRIMGNGRANHKVLDKTIINFKSRGKPAKRFF